MFHSNQDFYQLFSALMTILHSDQLSERILSSCDVNIFAYLQRSRGKTSQFLVSAEAPQAEGVLPFSHAEVSQNSLSPSLFRWQPGMPRISLLGRSCACWVNNS